MESPPQTNPEDTPGQILTQREIARAMGGENISPTSEPFLGMIDNNIINLIKSVSTSRIQLQGGGFGFEIIHPDIFSYIATLGHLARTSNLDKREAKVAYFVFRQTVRISRGIHAVDQGLLDVLGKIELEGYILYHGDAQEGRRQRYLSTQNRNINISQPQQVKKSWWSK